MEAEGQPTEAPVESQPAPAAEPAQPTPSEASQAAAPSGDQPAPRQIRPIPPQGADGKFQKKDLKDTDLGFKPRADRDGSPEKLAPGAARPGKAPAPPAVALKPGEKPPEAPPVPGAQPQPKTEPFKFAGREWESREKAEHGISTFMGMWKAKENESAQNASNAAAWYQVAKKLGYQDGTDPFAQQPAGSQQSASQSAAAPEPSADDSLGALKGIDMGVYAALVQDPTVGPAGAAAWLASEVAKNQEASIMEKVSAMVEPFQQDAQERATVAQLTQGVSQVYGWAEQQKAAGNPEYSRVGDTKYDTELGQVMAYMKDAMGVTEQVLLSPMGHRMAMLIHRDIYGPGASVPGATVNPAAAAVTAQLTQPRQGGEPVSGPSAAPSNPGRPRTQEEQVKQQLREANPVDPVLGFRRRGASAGQVI